MNQWLRHWQHNKPSAALLLLDMSVTNINPCDDFNLFPTTVKPAVVEIKSMFIYMVYSKYLQMTYYIISREFWQLNTEHYCITVCFSVIDMKRAKGNKIKCISFITCNKEFSRD